MSRRGSESSRLGTCQGGEGDSHHPVDHAGEGAAVEHAAVRQRDTESRAALGQPVIQCRGVAQLCWRDELDREPALDEAPCQPGGSHVFGFREDDEC
jgi:hypothetical protein